jgi:methionyl-tRNA formyltransferase
MAAGIDTGGVLSQKTEPILPDDTAGSLADRLARLGAALLIETLPEYLAGSLQPSAQDETQASYAPILRKENGLLDFNQTAIILERQVRAYLPWPGAFILWQNQPLKVLHASVGKLTHEERPTNPGHFLRYQGLPAVQTSDGVLVFEVLQPAGKRVMTGKAFLQGVKNW